MSTLFARPVHEFHATGKRIVNQKWQERDHSPHAMAIVIIGLGMTCCFQMLFENGIRLVASSQSSDGMKNVPKSGILQVEFWKKMDEYGAYVPQSIGWTRKQTSILYHPKYVLHHDCAAKYSRHTLAQLSRVCNPVSKKSVLCGLLAWTSQQTYFSAWEQVWQKPW